MKEILDIDSFDQKCVIIKGLLHSNQLKNTLFILGLTNISVTVICINIDVWKKSRSYTRMWTERIKVQRK